MAHLDIELPRRIRSGVVGGPEFSTEIVEVNNGTESRNGLWYNGKLRLEVEYVQDFAAKESLVQFFRAVRGKLHSFNVRDWSDYQCSAGVFLSSSGVVGLDGGATAQLAKRYQASTESEYRKIQKPEVVTLTKSGVVQTTGFTLNKSTGVITWTASNTKAISSFTVGSVTTVNTSVAHGFTSGKVVSFSNVSGTLGAALNGKGFAITVTGSYAFTIAFNSTGLTGSSGNVVTYPVAADGWAWSGTFFTPMRFDSDKLEITMQSESLFEINGLQLVEVRL